MTTNQKRNYKDRQYGDQKCEDTKGVIRSHKYKDRQYGDQKCEDTKGVIRSRKYKDRQYGDQSKNEKGTNKDLHKSADKTND